MALRRTLSSALLIKFAKHLALLACVIIVSDATGRSVVGEFGIFLLVVIAAFTHSVGRALQLSIY